MSVDPFISLTARCFVGLLMLAGGLHKAVEMGRFAAAIAGYRIVPDYLARPVALLLVGIEVTIGMTLMASDLKEGAALAAAGLLALYFAAMATNLLRGQRQVDCGCSFAGRAIPLSSAHLIRNAVLVILALVASMPDSGRALGVLDGAQIAAAVLSLSLIYLSAEALLAQGIHTPGQEA